MIKHLPKFSAPNRAIPIAFSPIQLGTNQYSQVYPSMSGGWTNVLAIDSATQIIYIDPVGGLPEGLVYTYFNNPPVGYDPTNPVGVIEAWNNLSSGLDYLFNTYGNQVNAFVLIKRNTVFPTGQKLCLSDGSWPFLGNALNEFFVVGAYGNTTGNRPKFTSAETPLTILGDPSNRGNVLFRNLSFHNIQRDPSHPSYDYNAVNSLGAEAIHIYTSTTAGNETNEMYVFDDCEIKFYRDAINCDGNDPIYNVLFNRCAISNIYALSGNDSSAVYFAGGHNVEFRECVFDKIGFYPYDPSGRSFGSNRNQTFYVGGLYNDQFKFINNIISDAAHAGIQLRGGSGHIVSGNAIMRTAEAISFGHDQNNYDDVYGNGISMNPGIRFHQAEILGNLVMKPNNIPYASGLYEAGRIRGAGISAGRVNSARIVNNIVTHPYKSSGNCYALSFSEFSWPWDNHKSDVLVSGNIAFNWIGSNDVAGASMHLGTQKTTQGFTYKKLPEDNFKFVKNVLIEPNATGVNAYTKGILYDPVFAFGRGSYLSSGNTFYRVASSGGYVAFNDTTSYNWTNWMSDLGDTSSVYGTGIMVTQDWDAPDRDDVSYVASLGLSTASGEDSFILRALANRYGAWDDRFTASGLINYVSAGFASIIVSISSGNLFGMTAFHALNLDVFHVIRRRNL